MDTTTKPAGFDDLEDDLDAATGAADPLNAGTDDAPAYVEQCPKCHGTGKYHHWSSLGHDVCTKCKGAGSLVFATSPEQRAKERTGRARRKVKATEDKLAAFEAEHPDLKEWWTGSDFAFAVDMRQAVQKFGHLTDKQLAAAKNCAAKLAAAKVAREAERAEREAHAKDVDVSEIAKAMALAQSNGIKRPMVRLARFKFKPAPDTGRNAGAIYVTDRETDGYMGKIDHGKFFASRECTADLEAQVVDVASNPREAAIAYGKQYGQCAICGRELSDAESVKRGIGPICADKYGF